MKRILTILVLFILTASVFVFTHWKVEATHVCGYTCNQFTDDNICTHGCYGGGDPNPDYRNTADPQYHSYESVPAELRTDGGNFSAAKDTREKYYDSSKNYKVDSEIPIFNKQKCAKSTSSDDENCTSVSSPTGTTDKFGNKTGVHGSSGKLCDDSKNQDSGESNLACHGEVIVHVCPSGPSSSQSGGAHPICINSIPFSRTGDINCVALANEFCSFIQLDVVDGNGSAMTCYPTNCQTTSVIPTSGLPGETTNPPGEEETQPDEEKTPTPTKKDKDKDKDKCDGIKVYDAQGKNITDDLRKGKKTLAIGETVTLATPKGKATQAHFRIQGVTQYENNDPSLTKDGEFRLKIQIPPNITQSQGSFEAEVFIGGNWK